LQHVDHGCSQLDRDALPASVAEHAIRAAAQAHPIDDLRSPAPIEIVAHDGWIEVGELAVGRDQDAMRHAR